MGLPSFKLGTVIRFLVVTVGLGALGSGVWDWLLKPSLTGISRLLLNVTTFGIKTFKDSLYQEIARGLHEQASISMVTLLYSVLPGFILGFVVSRWRHRLRRGTASPSPPPRWLIEAFAGVLVVVAITLLIQGNQLFYINRAVAHSSQLFAITAPYISEESRLTYRSKFAQIASSEDYAALDRELVAVCRAKALKCPSFSIW